MKTALREEAFSLKRGGKQAEDDTEIVGQPVLDTNLLPHTRATQEPSVFMLGNGLM